MIHIKAAYIFCFLSVTHTITPGPSTSKDTLIPVAAVGATVGLAAAVKHLYDRSFLKALKDGRADDVDRKKGGRDPNKIVLVDLYGLFNISGAIRITFDQPRPLLDYAIALRAKEREDDCVVGDGDKKIRTLIEMGAHLSHQDEWMRTPLHYVPSGPVAQFLIKAKKRELGLEDSPLSVSPSLHSFLNATDQWGRTPLHEAVRHNRKFVIEQLLSYGASPFKMDNQGFFALELSRFLKTHRPIFKKVLDQKFAERLDQEAEALWQVPKDIQNLIISYKETIVYDPFQFSYTKANKEREEKIDRREIHYSFSFTRTDKERAKKIARGEIDKIDPPKVPDPVTKDILEYIPQERARQQEQRKKRAAFYETLGGLTVIGGLFVLGGIALAHDPQLRYNPESGRFERLRPSDNPYSRFVPIYQAPAQPPR